MRREKVYKKGNPLQTPDPITQTTTTTQANQESILQYEMFGTRRRNHRTARTGRTAPLGATAPHGHHTTTTHTTRTHKQNRVRGLRAVSLSGASTSL